MADVIPMKPAVVARAPELPEGVLPTETVVRLDAFLTEVLYGDPLDPAGRKLGVFAGPTGVGKSHLARAWAREREELYVLLSGGDELKRHDLLRQLFWALKDHHTTVRNLGWFGPDDYNPATGFLWLRRELLHPPGHPEFSKPLIIDEAQRLAPCGIMALADLAECGIRIALIGTDELTLRLFGDHSKEHDRRRWAQVSSRFTDRVVMPPIDELPIQEDREVLARGAGIRSAEAIGQLRRLVTGDGALREAALIMARAIRAAGSAEAVTSKHIKAAARAWGIDA
ncbi:AAA family ATPase [Elioraea sp.]|uniref:AAA family ATPase n=1 Tax=Elioraea sp. TaxID=2185103 RepID=UPI003F6F1273